MDPKGYQHHSRFISKVIDFDDYALNDVIFQGINSLWDPHTIDRFAYSYNANLPSGRFNPRFFQPGCEAVDTGGMIIIGSALRFALLSEFKVHGVVSGGNLSDSGLEIVLLLERLHQRWCPPE